MYDFANILLSGPCNLRCRHCIGRQLARRADRDNLGRFPLAGLERFCRALRRAGVTQVALTGTDTDPLLYRHHGELLGYLRRHVPGVRVSLHTNGVLALGRIDLVNSYHRVCVSLPSLRPATCLLMTGRTRALDLAALVQQATVPLKVSTLVTRHNVSEVLGLVDRCRELGIRRMVLRRLHVQDDPTAGAEPWRQVLAWLADLPVTRAFGGNPVLDAGGVELTLWDFRRTRVRCLNLFSDGQISPEYRLDRGACKRPVVLRINGASAGAA